MIDIKLLRKDRENIEKKLKRKEPSLDLSSILRLDEEIRLRISRVEQKKAERNEISKKIGEAKRKGEDASEWMAKAQSFSDEIHELDREIRELEESFTLQLAAVPNIPMDDIPDSQNIEDNVVLKEVGPKPTFDFPFKNHLELNEQHQLFDFSRAAKVAGKGWPAYRGMGAQLEWALIQYMLSVHIKNGFEMWMPPLVVREEVMYASGQLPKFANQQFHVADHDFPFYLIPTAEVPLNGLHLNEIFSMDDLPKFMVAYTPCFRREAGAAGEKERGLIRMHQFNKVEMFSFCPPEESEQAFDRMVGCAEEILQGLDLHYRNVLLVTGDMSFAAAKTVDIEVWLPGQNRYYEVSSVSNCTDYQSRRSLIRFRRKQGEKPELVHTLNGSGLATSRLMVSILENGQQADGSIAIPQVLQPYLNGQTHLTP